jgi:hypothetical protein
MIEKLQNLQAALDVFKDAPAADRKAAASLATAFAKQVEFSVYSADDQYRALAIAASRRTSQDLQLLDDLANFSNHEHIRKAATEERNPNTSLFAGNARRAIPETLV